MRKKFFISFLISIIIFSLIYTGNMKEIWSFILDRKDMKTVENKVEIVNNKGRKKDEFIFVLLGVDADDVKDSKNSRTDTIMLVKANFKEGSIDMTSIPRDTKVLINGKDDKINHAHAYGGAEMTIDTIRNFMGIDLKHYVKVDYQIVMEMVNAMGGVEIDVPMDMVYKDPTADPPLDINISKGVQKLDGKQSHDFLRFRSGYKEGDVGRVKAQQEFMKAFIKQSLKLRNMPKFFKIYKKNVETNIPMSTVLRGGKLALGLKSENVTSEILPGEGKYIGKRSYFVTYENQLRDLINRKYYNFLLN